MLKDIKVLIVEDEKPLSDAIQTKLEKEGFTTAVARNVDQAIDYLNDPDFKGFDAVWLDHYLLGEKTGLDFLNHCRNESEKCASIPIFVVTNTGGHEKKETYMELGATEYFIKSNSRLDQIIQEIKKKLSE